jgi:hypothetical protein
MAASPGCPRTRDLLAGEVLIGLICLNGLVYKATGVGFVFGLCVARKSNVRSPAILLCAFYIVAKIYARYWLFRPVHARPAVTRDNQVLRLIDLAALTSLIGAFFLLANLKNGLRPALVTAAVLLIFDAGIRYAFLHLEVRRLCASSPKWKYRGALKHVRRRATSLMFR